MTFQVSRGFFAFLIILGLIGGGYYTGIISPVDPPNPTPTVIAEGDTNAEAVATAKQNIAEMTVTPGSDGQDQMETAIPTKTIVIDLASAETMRTSLHEKMVKEPIDWLMAGRITTGGGSYDCFNAYFGGNFQPGHPEYPLWEMFDKKMVTPAPQKMKYGGCIVTLMIADMEAGIPASALRNINNYEITTEQYTYETADAIVTASRVKVIVTVPIGYHGLVIRPGNEFSGSAILPSEVTASMNDLGTYLLSFGKEPADLWRKFVSLENGADNLAILDVEAPILDWRTGERSTTHLDELWQVAQMSANDPTAEGGAYNTIQKIVCAAAMEAKFKDIPAVTEQGDPATLKSCVVEVKLIMPNPTKPEEWYHLDSITTPPATFDDTTGWQTYIAALNPVIKTEDFVRYNWDNAYTFWAPDLAQINLWSMMTEAMKQSFRPDWLP